MNRAAAGAMRARSAARDRARRLPSLRGAGRARARRGAGRALVRGPPATRSRRLSGVKFQLATWTLSRSSGRRHRGILAGRAGCGACGSEAPARTHGGSFDARRASSCSFAGWPSSPYPCFQAAGRTNRRRPSRRARRLRRRRPPRPRRPRACPAWRAAAHRPRPDGGNLCDMRGPTFQDDVVLAIRRAAGEQPQIFEDSPGGVIILSPGQFYVGLIEKLDKKGLCAGFDGEELQVKASNDVQRPIRASAPRAASCARTRRSTARPASRPPSRRPCLRSSRPTRVHARPQPGADLHAGDLPLLHDIERSIDDVMRTRPELFDFTPSPLRARDLAPGRDFDAYHEDVVQSMIAKGYCATSTARRSR